MKKIIIEYGEALLYVVVGFILIAYFTGLLNIISSY